MHKCSRTCQVNYCVSLSEDQLLGLASIKSAQGGCGGVKNVNIVDLRLRQIFLHALAEALTKGLVVEKVKEE